jgi:uncharacterized coiled-coil protein SlyX
MNTDTKELAAELRRIADGILFGRPSLVANQAADRLEELEEQLSANHEAIKLMGKWLEDERALADRLANALVESMERLGVCAGHRKVLDQWKEARNDT